MSTAEVCSSTASCEVEGKADSSTLIENTVLLYDSDVDEALQFHTIAVQTEVQVLNISSSLSKIIYRDELQNFLMTSFLGKKWILPNRRSRM